MLPARLWACCLLVACARQIPLGAVDASGDAGAGPLDQAVERAFPGVLWFADFEVGDLSQWSEGGKGGTYQQSATSAPAVEAVEAHGGRLAARISIAPVGGEVEVSYFSRRAEPPSAYYSAWFFIPRPTTANFYWNLVHWNGSRTGDGENQLSLWDVDLRSDENGALVPYVYDFQRNRQINQTSPAPVAVPIGRWFQIETLFRKEVSAPGRIVVWLDGAPIFDIDDVPTVLNDWLLWNVGSASTELAPSPAEVWIDDAAISLNRLGL